MSTSLKRRCCNTEKNTQSKIHRVRYRGPEIWYQSDREKISGNLATLNSFHLQNVGSKVAGKSRARGENVIWIERLGRTQLLRSVRSNYMGETDMGKAKQLSIRGSIRRLIGVVGSRVSCENRQASLQEGLCKKIFCT